MHNATTDADIKGWRAACFEELGFSEGESERLAETRDSAGWLVSIHEVRTALEHGCSHTMALRIFV